MVIYKITNNINGKIYIGQTKQSLNARWARHCSRRKNSALSMAIHKYGKDNFTVETLMACSTIEEMNLLEVEYINKFNSMSPNGYNLTTGGKNGLHTEETKKKIGSAQTGYKNHMFGKKASEETRLKMSLSHKGKHFLSEESKKAISERVSGEKHPMYGKHHSEEARAKISASLKGRPCPTKGIPVSEETKAKISASLKGRITSEETRAKLRSNNANKVSIVCIETGVIYESVSEAARQIGCLRKHIRDQIKGKRKTARGLTFKVA